MRILELTHHCIDLISTDLQPHLAAFTLCKVLQV